MNALETIKAELSLHISVDEVCEAFQISRKTLDRWRKELNFPQPIIHHRKMIKFHQDHISAWLEMQKNMHEVKAGGVKG